MKDAVIFPEFFVVNIEKESCLSFPLQYGNCTVKGLKEGEVKLWCRCGLSKTQPWCDGKVY